MNRTARILCPRPYSEMYRNFVFPGGPNVADSLVGKPEEQRVWAGRGAGPTARAQIASPTSSVA